MLCCCATAHGDEPHGYLGREIPAWWILMELRHKPGAEQLQMLKKLSETHVKCSWITSRGFQEHGFEHRRVISAI